MQMAVVHVLPWRLGHSPISLVRMLDSGENILVIVDVFHSSFIGIIYMGWFTLPMLLDFSDFRHILTILAQGELFRVNGSAYDRIETMRRAQLAWCSLSVEKMKKAPDQIDPRLRTDYGE